MEDRLAIGLRVSALGLVANAGLALIKLVAGILGNSYALIADAIESLGDLLSTAIVCVGLVIASKPPDENHAYGHGKAESLATLVVAIMLLLAAATIAIQAVGEIRTPHHAPAPFTLIVLLAVVTIKEGMYRYQTGAGHRMDSTLVKADAWHHRSDAMTSVAAGIGIAIALAGGPGYESADDWAALAACGVILFNGVNFSRTAIAELMDTTPDMPLVDSIRESALGVEGALLVEKLLVRRMGHRLYVDLHLEVDRHMTVEKAHGIAHAVKDAIKNEHRQVADVLVHVEPARIHA
jgi:cation diffusion facilitator family transporter